MKKKSQKRRCDYQYICPVCNIGKLVIIGNKPIPAKNGKNIMVNVYKCVACNQIGTRKHNNLNWRDKCYKHTPIPE